MGDGGEFIGGSTTSPPSPVLTALVLSAPGNVFNGTDPTNPLQLFGELIAYRLSTAVSGTRPATGILAQMTLDMSMSGPGMYPLILSVPGDPTTKTTLYGGDVVEVPTTLGEGVITIVPEPGVAFLFIIGITLLPYALQASTPVHLRFI